MNKTRLLKGFRFFYNGNKVLECVFRCKCGSGGALIDYAAKEQDKDMRPELTSHIIFLEQCQLLEVGIGCRSVYRRIYHQCGKSDGSCRRCGRLAQGLKVLAEVVMKRKIIWIMAVAFMLLCTACAGQNAETEDRGNAVSSEAEGAGIAEEEITLSGEEGAVSMSEQTDSGQIPDELAQIPEEYFLPASEQGTIERLDYQTYESMSYENQTTRLDKTAYVYLPSGYSEEKSYNVLYLMHGGWSDETTYLGTPEDPHELKNVMDHSIQDGKIAPVIVVCPTYNNTSAEDSADYSLALRLTDNYHNELVNDLLPAVEGTYSTYAKRTSVEALKASRNHRVFAGFSMGSVATWHTFQYCLDYFRYFLPSSGSLTSNGADMESMVTDSGHAPDDFFIYAMSGTEDFAYAGFSGQIEAMLHAPGGIFTVADTESGGNLAYRVQEGNSHDGEAAMQYIYNGLIWLWQS